MKFSFLIHNVYGVGGTNRTILNLSEALAEAGHTVEIASVLRRLDAMSLAVSDRVTIKSLVDFRPRRPDRTDPRRHAESALCPPDEEFARFYSQLTDERLSRYLKATDADVVVGTRPALNLAVAMFAPDCAIRVAQEHMTHGLIAPMVREAMQRWYPRLHGSLTVTAADADTFRDQTPIPGLDLRVLPNSVPAPDVRLSDLEARVVVAAGRLDPIKRYDVLIHAFARVVRLRPDWTLRIYGDGGERSALRELVISLGLYNHVVFMGRSVAMETEWAKGSIAAVTSDRESFGMTIVEAMRCGLPVVSTACPVGPAEILHDGEDGLLVPVGDDAAVADAVLRLIDDVQLRRDLGAQARQNARRFDPTRIADDFVAMVREWQAADPATLVPASRRPITRIREQIRSLDDQVRTIANRPDRLRTVAEPMLQMVANRQAMAKLADQMLAKSAAISGLRGSSLRARAAIARRTPERTAKRTADGIVEPAGCTVLRFADAPGAVVLMERLPGGAEPRQIRLDVETDVDGGAVARVPQRLPEGRWNVFVTGAAGRLHRIAAGRIDTRVLVDWSCVDTSASGVSITLPYRATDGHLIVRAWSRAEHAEVESIDFGDEALVVRAWMPDGVASEPVVRLVRRADERTLQTTGTRVEAERFEVRLPIQRLATVRLTRYDDWDVYVLSPTTGQPVRMARLFDDVVERKNTYVYPSIRVEDDIAEEMDLDGADGYPPTEEYPAVPVRVRPYFTVGSDLSLVVSER